MNRAESLRLRNAQRRRARLPRWHWKRSTRYLIKVEILEENLERPPTVAEVADSVDVTHTAASDTLQRLEALGLLHRCQVCSPTGIGRTMVSAYSLSLLGNDLLSGKYQGDH